MVSDEVPRNGGGFRSGAVAGVGVGSRVAGYRLEEQVGAGGMAVVFRARDERLGRLVALKILTPALAADEAFRQRFIRESRAAAAVDDPHIVPVFEAGEADGVLFIAMRFVGGGDVRGVMRREGPLTAARAVAVISPVASALDAAHGAGLVHRDVKPANMLVDTRAGRPDHVYLSDFGLSKGALLTSGLTGAGQFLGTVDYISPEQIEGRPVDGRADQYALACAAFELLAGVPPFRRDEAMAVMYAQLSEPPPPLAARRPDLPPAVDRVFARALAKAPADRYPSCRDFADALRAAFGVAPYDSGAGTIPPGHHPPTQLAGLASGAAATVVDGGLLAGEPGRPGSSYASRSYPVTGDHMAVTAAGAEFGGGAEFGDGTGDQPPPPGRRRRISPVALAGIGVLAAGGIAAAVIVGLPSHAANSPHKATTPAVTHHVTTTPSVTHPATVTPTTTQPSLTPTTAAPTTPPTTTPPTTTRPTTTPPTTKAPPTTTPPTTTPPTTIPPTTPPPTKAATG